MEESWSNESPNLTLVLDLVCILPPEGVQRSWVRSQKLSIYDSVEPHRNYKHGNVHKDDEYSEGAPSDCGAQVDYNSVDQCLISSSFVQTVEGLLPPLLGLCVRPSVEAAEKPLSLFILVASPVPSLLSLLFSPSSFSFFSESLQVRHY